jgi:hypothetical protein
MRRPRRSFPVTPNGDEGVAATKEAFDWEVFAKEEAKMKRKKLARLQNMATALNYRLVPIQ